MEQPSVEAQGHGVSVRAKGYRASDLIWALTVAGVIYFGLEARAAHTEMTALLNSQVKGLMLTTCIIAKPQEERLAELTNPNSYCNHMARTFR